jgi:hypothetical protein
MLQLAVTTFGESTVRRILGLFSFESPTQCSKIREGWLINGGETLTAAEEFSSYHPVPSVAA